MKPAPKGFPRVSSPAEFSAIAKAVISGRISSDPFESRDEIWTDAVYPSRFNIEESSVEIDKLFDLSTHPRSVVDAVRKSSTVQGRPFEAWVIMEENSHSPEAIPDLARISGDFSEALLESGISFGPSHTAFVSRFLASLAAKPFVILTGLSGSGKTQIALKFGQWLGADRFKLIAVRPDWTGPEALLGYEGALRPVDSDGMRSWHVPPALEFMLLAAASSSRPFLLILDEMNLAHVERYFADVLSGMESNTPVLPNLECLDGHWRLKRNAPSHIPFPPNLFLF